eukprot:13584655-Alexandrium_andersonii.AAC.1
MSPDACQFHRMRSVLGLPAGQGDGRGFEPCPLAGRRAVEFATGAIADQFETLSQSHQQALLEAVSPMLDPAELERLLSDFSSGKMHQLAYLQLKLQCWSVLPWKLAG